MSYKYNDKQYIIISITATYREDRENVLGVCRLTSLDITEMGSTISNEDKKNIEKEICDQFAENEYPTEDEMWKIEAANELKEYTGALNVCILTK